MDSRSSIVWNNFSGIYTKYHVFSSSSSVRGYVSSTFFSFYFYFACSAWRLVFNFHRSFSKYDNLLKLAFSEFLPKNNSYLPAVFNHSRYFSGPIASSYDQSSSAKKLSTLLKLRTNFPLILAYKRKASNRFPGFLT